MTGTLRVQACTRSGFANVLPTDHEGCVILFLQVGVVTHEGDPSFPNLFFPSPSPYSSPSPLSPLTHLPLSTCKLLMMNPRRTAAHGFWHGTGSCLHPPANHSCTSTGLAFASLPSLQYKLRVRVDSVPPNTPTMLRNP